jgi:hypothetical protein
MLINILYAAYNSNVLGDKVNCLGGCLPPSKLNTVCYTN